ncbi:MAG: hypothetical protein IKS23_05480 [Alphaproteobacteria bacterium]|nr:hypothetical protein [Alphaproteobacteria bacterium]
MKKSFEKIIPFFTDADAKRAYVLLAIVILSASPVFLTALYFQNEAGWIKWLTTFITAGVSYIIGRLFLAHIESKRTVWDILWIMLLIGCGAWLLNIYSQDLALMSDIPQWGCALILAAFAILGVFMPSKGRIIRLTKSLRLKVIGNMPNLEEEDDSEVRVLSYTLPREEEEDDSEVQVLSYRLPRKEEDDSEVEVLGYTKPKTE